MDSLLHKLMCLSIITSATFYVTNQFQDKEVLWLTEGRKLAKLIGTANTSTGILYYLDTNNDPKTAEYITCVKTGSRAEAQMSAQLYNNRQKDITSMPLSKWRDISDTFQKVQERF